MPKSNRRRRAKDRPKRPPAVRSSQDSKARVERAQRGVKRRNATIDSLRGLAILLMIVDHVCAILFNLDPNFESIRFATRFAMPMFAILMGYLLEASGRWNPTRHAQLALAALASNAVYWPLYGYQEFEILASLLFAYSLYQLMPRWFVGGLALVLVAPIDPTQAFLNYRLSIVVSFVALGVLLRRQGWLSGLGAAVLITVAGFWIGWLAPHDPSRLLFWFVVPVVFLIGGSRRFPDIGVYGLQQLGRYPLTAYLAQFAVIFTIAYLIVRYSLL